MKRIMITLLVVAALACAKKEQPAPVAVDQAAKASQQSKFDLPPDHPVIGTMGETAKSMGPVTTSTAPQQMPAGHPPAGGMGGAKPVVGAQKISGKVLEAKDAGDFTYLRLNTASGEQWIAAQRAVVKVGSNVTIIPRMTADDFESKAMGRTFKHLVFGVVEGAPAPKPAMGGGMPPVGMMGDTGSMGSMHAASKTVDAGPISVPRAVGGKTVSEIHAQRASLKDRNVAVRGKVVKFLPNIMGRNWIHLQDGTGSKEIGDNELTITTTATAAVGDVVVVNGAVRVDQKMAMGMSYPVMIEGARVSK